ncbi:MAG: hypothetical protein D3909_13875 [Candidatus Electrothrix sp. ATG1]|nr:hypothetical protein [Candidatus Electrothrix sp. ATG1]MCI5207432.1 hypothetical protein [Candidatus Electrothrix sp. ATG2]
MLRIRTEEGYNAIIISLSYNCPFHLKNPNCPLKEARKKNFEEKTKWLNKLSLSTKQTIYQYHMLCYSKNKKKKDEELSGHNLITIENKADIIVSDQSKSLASKCLKGFSCLTGKTAEFCEVKKCLLGSVLYVQNCTKEYCSYRYSIGGDTFCNCAVRKELYNKYKI